MKDGTHVLLFNESNEIFMIFRTDKPIWDLPGGGVEEGESGYEAALRETEEETGFKVLIHEVPVTYAYSQEGKPSRLSHVFIGLVVGGEYQPEFEGNVGQWFPFDSESLPLNEVTTKTRMKLTDIIEGRVKIGDIVEIQIPLETRGGK